MSRWCASSDAQAWRLRKAGMLIDCSLSNASARLPDRGALGGDAGHQIVPRFDEGRGALPLEPGSQRVDVDPRLGEAGENRLPIAGIRSEQLADLAMVGESFERAFGHGVDREGRRERLHI